MMMENGNSGDVRKRLESEKNEERNNGTCNADANNTSTGNGTTNKRDDGPGSDLLHWKDMPQHLQFNPYIFTGYRPMLSFWGCINSLFYMHNETINIITHAVPIVYILVTVPGLMPWGEPEFRFLSWCHLLGSVSPWVGSFLYHLFMNLERGESVYYRLLQLDMLGIWISQSFGAMPMVTSTVYCLPALVRWTCILSYCLLSLWGLYKNSYDLILERLKILEVNEEYIQMNMSMNKFSRTQAGITLYFTLLKDLSDQTYAMTAWSPWERRLCFLLPFSMRMLLCGLRVSSLGGGAPEALTHVFLQDAVSVIGAAIGAMHIPEKWFPGTVDMYLNSHNIMHVLVVAAVYSMHHATVKDFNWMVNVQCRATVAQTLHSTVTTVNAGL